MIAEMASNGELSSQLPVIHKLRYFMRSGNEAPVFNIPRNRPDFQTDDLTAVMDMVADGKGPDIVAEILQASRTADTVRPDAIIFALAACAKNVDVKTRIAAAKAVEEVCKTPEDLLNFVRYCEAISKPTGTGWGRSQRRAVSTWYNNKDPKVLASWVTRCISRKHWTHKDLIKLSHLKPANQGLEVVTKYILKGLDEAQKVAEAGDKEVNDVIEILSVIDKLKHTTDDQVAARLLESHKLTVDHVPSPLLKSKELWASLINVLPLADLLQQVNRLGHLGLLRPNSTSLAQFLDRLKAAQGRTDSELNPSAMDVFMAMKQYEAGGSKAQKIKPVKHKPSASVIEALYNTFHVLLKSTLSTGKRYLLAVDVRNPMVHSHVYGCRSLSPAIASAVLALSLVNAESEVTVAAFAGRGMTVLDVGKQMALPEVLKRMRETPMGPVNCSLPLLWAQEQQKAYDVIIICSDNQVDCGEVPTADALVQYRDALKLPQTKLVVCALATKMFVDPLAYVPGALYVAGFSAEVLPLIQKFSQTKV